MYRVLACHSLMSEHFFPLACQDQTCFIKTLLGACVRVACARGEGRGKVCKTRQKQIMGNKWIFSLSIHHFLTSIVFFFSVKRKTEK